MANLIVLTQLMIFISSIDKIKVKFNESNYSVFMLFFLLFIVAVCSSLFSNLKIESLKTSYLVFVTSLFLVLLTLSDNNPYETLIKMIKTEVMIGMVFSIIAIITFFFGQVNSVHGTTVQAITIGSIEIYQVIVGQPPGYRVASLTTNPNTLGIILMLSQIATIYLLKTKLITKKKFVVFYAIQIISLMLTQSRGAIITAFIMLVVFFILSSKNQKSRIKIYIFSIMLIIFALYIISNKYLYVFNRFQKGLNGRALPWEILVNQILNKPLIGIGFGTSGKTLLYNLGIGAHNVFINSMSEMGVIGFAIFMGIWFLGMGYSYMGVKKNKNNQEIKTTYALIFSILFAFIFHQMIENKLLVYDHIMFLWVYLISISTLKLVPRTK